MPTWQLLQGYVIVMPDLHIFISSCVYLLIAANRILNKVRIAMLSSVAYKQQQQFYS